MNSKVKNLIKGIIVFIVFALILAGMSRLFTLKSLDGIEQMRSFYKQKDNTVDVLFLGSSKVYCQIDNGILWDEYGISSFDLGGAEAPPWNSYYYMKEALKTQTPKVIIYDASIIGYRSDVLAQPEVWAITNNYGMKWNKNRIDQLKSNTQDEKMFYKLLFPLGSMHSRYNELTKDDFVDSKNSINFKGFDFRNTLYVSEKPDMSGVWDTAEFDEKFAYYLKEMINLAKEKNVPFVVMISPYCVSVEEQMIFNAVGEICKENDTVFLNFNNMYDELGLDFTTDMAETVHVNLRGSKKFTDYLGKYVVANYGVVDHRGDEKYSSWDVDADTNRQIREDNQEYSGQVFLDE